MREFVISSFVQALYTRSYRKKKSKEPLALGNAESPPGFFSFYPPCAPETQDSDKIKDAKSLQSSQDFQFDTSHSIFLGNIFSLLGVFRLKDRKVVPQEPRCKGQCHSSRKESLLLNSWRPLDFSFGVSLLYQYFAKFQRKKKSNLQKNW